MSATVGVDRKSSSKPQGSSYEVGDWVKVIDGQRLHTAKIIKKTQSLLTWYTVSFPGSKIPNGTLNSWHFKCHTVSPEEQPQPPPAMYKLNDYVTARERVQRVGGYEQMMTGCILTGQIKSMEYQERATESEWVYNVRQEGRYEGLEVKERHVLKVIPPPVDINKEIPELKAQIVQLNQTLSDVLNVMKGIAEIASATVKK